MGFWPAAALAGGSVLSGIANLVGANEAADAAKDAARENSQNQRYMFDQSVRLSEPWRQAGMAGLNEQMALLGIAPQGGNAFAVGGAPGGNDYMSYVNSNPDLVNAFTTLSPENQRHLRSAGYDRNNDGRITQDEYGQFHYERYGQNGGRTMPTFAAPTAEQTAQSQDDAYGRFLDGGFARSMLETTESDFDRYMGAFGAGGTAMSGATLGALNDRNRRNTNSAFTQHWNALGGMSGSGQGVAQSQGAQGMQLGAQLAANNNQAAQAQGSSYMNAANAFSGALQGATDTYMYGRGQGWWGGK